MAFLKLLNFWFNFTLPVRLLTCPRKKPRQAIFRYSFQYIFRKRTHKSSRQTMARKRHGHGYEISNCCLRNIQHPFLYTSYSYNRNKKKKTEALAPNSLFLFFFQHSWAWRASIEVSYFSVGKINGTLTYPSLCLRLQLVKEISGKLTVKLAFSGCDGVWRSWQRKVGFLLLKYLSTPR